MYFKSMRTSFVPFVVSVVCRENFVALNRILKSHLVDLSVYEQKHLFLLVFAQSSE